MISVLIPVYREQIDQLVNDLYNQLQWSGQPFEILIGDDSCLVAPDQSTRPVEERNEVKVFYHKDQMGRCKNRNFLAAQAQHPNLLFLDGDAQIIETDFISKYLKATDGKSVLCGGTSYQNKPPDRVEQRLRWKYGMLREVRTADERSQQAYGQFSSFNFLIPSEIFDRVKFNEDFALYGHEDTFFGFQLEQMGIQIVHLDNPAQHNGLDDAGVFLDKIQQSILSLNHFYSNHLLPDEFLGKIRLIKTFKTIRLLRLRFLILLLFSLFKPRIQAQLNGSQPRVRLLDFYKLGYLNQIAT